MTINDETIAKIKALHVFALAHYEFAFAHLCADALTGEPWAVDRVVATLDDIAQTEAITSTGNYISTPTLRKLYIIRSTKKTRQLSSKKP